MMIPQSSSGHAIFWKKRKAKLLGPNIPIKNTDQRTCEFPKAHGFPTKVTIIYLGLVKQPCFNGWLISMNAASQRRAARFFHIVRKTGPIPFREELTMDCLAFQARQLCGAEIALLRVKMLPDMKKRSLLAGTEVFAPVYEQIHLLSFIDVLVVVVA